jgi:cyclophilin family peptidyl-prolyl cis-trans isomerase
VLWAGLARPSAAPAPSAQSSTWAGELTIIAAEDNRIDLPPWLHTPVIDALWAKQDEEMRVLVTLTRSSDPTIQKRAMRALGRYENRAFTATLLQFLATGPSRTDAAIAVVLSLRGEPLPIDTSNRQVQMAFELLAQLASTDNTGDLGTYAQAIGRLPYTKDVQVKAAEAFLLGLIQRVDSFPKLRALDADFAGALETLARVHGRLSQLSPETIEWLRRIAINRRGLYTLGSRIEAMAALIAGRGMDEETLREAAGEPGLRRLAAVVLGGGGSPLAPTERADLLRTLLADRAIVVRIEAVRAYARQEARVNGCVPLLEATKDPDLPVALMAIDLLADQCREDANVTDRLASEARTPPPGEWHRAAHALVSLAKRDPERAKIPLGADIPHETWWVRMYAARAAAIMNDVVALERLAVDANANVQEAALPALRKLKGAESDPVFIDILLRATDYQLLRTAARELAGAAATPALSSALIDALRRVTAEKRDTSRDVRLALLERIDELGDPDQAGHLVPLLQDFDIRVALAASATLQKWTGKPMEIAPQLQPRSLLPTQAEIEEAGSRPARVTLASGKIMKITLMPDVAPLASVRFLRLAKAGYYNGLTFHRIELNFVIQGGSPGANEYSGDGPFVHDEISAAGNSAGSVGLSTRGRDTGDAQFYINLVDNPRLDFEYTIFGRTGAGELIVEGDRIDTISFEKEKDEKQIARRVLHCRNLSPGVLQWSLPACAAGVAAR